MVDLGIDGLVNAHLVGKGGTASVYRAETGDGDIFAVKVFAAVWDDDQQRRFERELEAMELLNSVDGVVKLYEQGQTSTGLAYFTMPFYENGSLQNALTKNGAFPWEQAIRHIDGVAKTLTKTHELGVFHRDLKPANILLDSDSRPVVNDFGITEIADGRSVSTMAAYTPGYCPPEALTKGRKGTDGASCDIYSLGATLWSLITGNQPFLDGGDHGTDPMVLRCRITTEPLANVPSAPAWVNEVIAYATAKEPGNRYRTLADFVNDIQSEGSLAMARPRPEKDLDTAGPGVQAETIVRRSRDFDAGVAVEVDASEDTTTHWSSNKRYFIAVGAVAVLAIAATGFWVNRDTAEVADKSEVGNEVYSPEVTDQQVPGAESSSGTSAAVEEISDEDLFIAIQSGLPAGVAATVDDGVVTLTGTAESETVKVEAESQIRSIVGVSMVINQLVVTEPTGSTRTTMTTTTSTAANGSTASTRANVTMPNAVTAEIIQAGATQNGSLVLKNLEPGEYYFWECSIRVGSRVEMAKGDRFQAGRSGEKVFSSNCGGVGVRPYTVAIEVRNRAGVLVAVSNRVEVTE